MRVQLIVLCAGLAAAPLMAQGRPDDAGARLRADMAVLASDSFGGRKPGTPGERRTTDYIVTRFQVAGLTPGSPAGWLQPVVVRDSAGAALFTSYNVAGLLKGSTRPDEYVLYTAHWDSFGRCRPGEADEICNGAVDNASGIAGMIELALRLAHGRRPDRSILFLATTAEELGFQGVRAYVASPLAPLEKTVVAFNLDVIALYERGNTVGFVGSGLTDADSAFARLAAAQGRTLDTGSLTKMVMKSSDAWPLLSAGVPAFILSGAIGTAPDGRDGFRAYLGTRYHRPGDEMRPDMPMGGAVEEVELLHAAGLHFAREGTSVTFLPDSPFQRKQVP